MSPAPKLHPDDVPRELEPLSKYLLETYGIEESPWQLADKARDGTLPAVKVRNRWRTTATAYLQAMSPQSKAV